MGSVDTHSLRVHCKWWGPGEVFKANGVDIFLDQSSKHQPSTPSIHIYVHLSNYPAKASVNSLTVVTIAIILRGLSNCSPVGGCVVWKPSGLGKGYKWRSPLSIININSVVAYTPAYYSARCAPTGWWNDKDYFASTYKHLNLRPIHMYIYEYK